MKTVLIAPPDDYSTLSCAIYNALERLRPAAWRFDGI